MINVRLPIVEGKSSLIFQFPHQQNSSMGPHERLRSLQQARSIFQVVENICVLELFGRIIDSRYYQKMRIHLLAESTLFLLDKADVSHIDTRTAAWRYSAAFLSRSLEMPSFPITQRSFPCHTSQSSFPCHSNYTRPRHRNKGQRFTKIGHMEKCSCRCSFHFVFLKHFDNCYEVKQKSCNSCI